MSLQAGTRSEGPLEMGCLVLHALKIKSLYQESGACPALRRRQDLVIKVFIS